MSSIEARYSTHTLHDRIYTDDDLERLPDGDRLELIRGELFPMPNNSADHGNKTMRLSSPIGVFVEEHGLGECFAAETRFTIARNPDTTVGPDFAFISRQRLQDIPAKGYLRMAPDLVVETRSPGDTRKEFALKIAQWLNAGTQIVWALDPATRSLTVHRTGTPPRTLTVGATLEGEEILPGFTLPMQRIFRDVVTSTGEGS
jgi:Uma2 family endonuclease